MHQSRRQARGLDHASRNTHHASRITHHAVRAIWLTRLWYSISDLLAMSTPTSSSTLSFATHVVPVPAPVPVPVTPVIVITSYHSSQKKQSYRRGPLQKSLCNYVAMGIALCTNESRPPLSAGSSDRCRTLVLVLALVLVRSRLVQPQRYP